MVAGGTGGSLLKHSILKTEYVMSQEKTLVNELRKFYAHTHGMLDGLIHLCPDDVWAAKVDNWPFWQHVYHAISWENNVRGVNEKPPAQLYTPEITNFKETIDGTPERGLLKEFSKVTKDFVDKYLDELTDEQLYQKHEGASARQNMDISTMAVVAMLSSHSYYHIGICDVAIRKTGRRGVFM